MVPLPLMSQPKALPCVTVTVWPATVIVAVRRPPEMIPTVHVTDPLPVTVVPLLTRIQRRYAVAVQGQSGAEAMPVTLAPTLPEAPTTNVVGFRFVEQGTPDWLTLRLSPPIQTVPLLETQIRSEE